MATSPIYGWLEPDNTDLVKNGALAIRTLGNAIDTTMGTMTPKSIVDAKGDLIAASANDTPARLAVGANGETLVADASTATGLRYQANFAAGKNKNINGDFGVWQRGTSFTSSSAIYTADRWWFAGATANRTVSRQTFTPGTAPVAGYEGQYFLRYAISSGTVSSDNLQQRIENVQTFAGQTATISFWAKADTTRSLPVFYYQDFGSGGSGAVVGSAGTASLTTSWQRFSFPIAIPSVSGKTIGTNSFFTFFLSFDGMATPTIDLWGIQAEAGNVATAFQTATGTIQGETSACQRYYYKATLYQTGFPAGTTDNNRRQWIQFPVTMRTTPSSYSITVDTGTPTADQATTAGFRALSAVGNTTTVAYFGTVEASAEL